MASERPKRSLEERILQAAEESLAALHYVSVVDVFIRIGWLAPSNFMRWQKGRESSLEQHVQANAGKIREAQTLLARWAASKDMVQSQGRYVLKTREGITDLRFTQTGDPAAEEAYRVHYASAAVTGKKRESLEPKLNRAPETVVFEILRDSKCTECGAELGKGSRLLLETEKALCLRCARLDDLEYLHRGDAALTRRATRCSSRKAVVVRFSRARGRYERQGLLLESEAIEKAKKESPC